MPVDKFGRMSDLKTKDTGVSLTYINNNYVRSDGQTPLTGSLNMRGNTLYNVADPVNPQDVVTKVYVDNTKGSGVIGEVKDETATLKGNLDFEDRYRIKNLPNPADWKDAVNMEYVERLAIRNPFEIKNNQYKAKTDLYMKKNKLFGLPDPQQDREAATKKYVDDTTKNLFIDENDNIAFGLNVDMEGNQVLGLPEPTTDQEPATKKYVDDLQTQYIDKKGNIKFDRNINVGNNRIFSLKDPKKDYEATNKKYVDDTINKRIQEEKDNFLPQDPATKEYVDEAIKQVAGGDLLVSKEGVFIKANGHYRATAPLDIDNHKMENLPDPVDEKDAVNKKYIDDTFKELTLKQGLIRENGGFNLVDSYINMNFNSIRNVGFPNHNEDAVPRSFVENSIKKAEERKQDRFKEINQLISVCGSFYGKLKNNDYQFTFGGPILNGKLNVLNKFNGFLVPANGVLKNFVTYSTGLIITVPNMSLNELKDEKFASVFNLYGNKDSLVKIFTLVKIEEKGKEEEELGGIYFRMINITESVELKQRSGEIEFKFILAEKFKNKEENFICSVNRGDIINIRSEYVESVVTVHSDTSASLMVRNHIDSTKEKGYDNEEDYYSLHTATLTFLFKEMSFPNVLNDN